MVVAGAITSGIALLSVSRKLRSINCLSSITYLVGFSKLPNKESYAQLDKDLCQGGHTLVAIRDCQLPRIKDPVMTAWDRECQLLSSWDETEDPLTQHTQPDIPPSLPDVLMTQLQKQAALKTQKIVFFCRLLLAIILNFAALLHFGLISLP